MHTLFYIAGGILGFILGVSITLFLLISYAFRKNNNWEGGNKDL